MRANFFRIGPRFLEFYFQNYSIISATAVVILNKTRITRKASQAWTKIADFYCKFLENSLTSERMSNKVESADNKNHWPRTTNVSSWNHGITPSTLLDKHWLRWTIMLFGRTKWPPAGRHVWKDHRRKHEHGGQWFVNCCVRDLKEISWRFLTSSIHICSTCSSTWTCNVIVVEICLDPAQFQTNWVTSVAMANFWRTCALLAKKGKKPSMRVQRNVQAMPALSHVSQKYVWYLPYPKTHRSSANQNVAVCSIAEACWESPSSPTTQHKLRIARAILSRKKNTYRPDDHISGHVEERK